MCMCSRTYVYIDILTRMHIDAMTNARFGWCIGRPMEAGTAILTVQRFKPKEIKYVPYLVSCLLTAGKVWSPHMTHYLRALICPFLCICLSVYAWAYKNACNTHQNSIKRKQKHPCFPTLPLYVHDSPICSRVLVLDRFSAQNVLLGLCVSMNTCLSVCPICILVYWGLYLPVWSAS
jgi:hypothetical protein